MPLEGDDPRPLIEQLGTPLPTYVGQPTADAPHYETNTTPGGTTGTHTVAAGETLGTLAQRYGTSVEELMDLNSLSNPDLVHVGKHCGCPA